MYSHNKSLLTLFRMLTYNQEGCSPHYIAREDSLLYRKHLVD